MLGGNNRCIIGAAAAIKSEAQVDPVARINN
jgi:hypothetical protein